MSAAVARLLSVHSQVLGAGAGLTLMCFSQDLQSKDLPNTRIQPDRRWFGNTRVIGQKQLDQFREEMSAKGSPQKAYQAA